MLLYHFPLTSSSSTPNYENKGFGTMYADSSLSSELESIATANFVNEGKLSSYCPNVLTTPFYFKRPEVFSIAMRVKGKTGVSWTEYDYVGFYNIDDTGGFLVAKHASESSNLLLINDAWSTQQTTYRSLTDNGIWNDVIVNFDILNSKITIYLNGVVYNSLTVVKPITQILKVCISSRRMYAQDIRIYDYALSQAEIKEYSRALVVHYPLQGNELNPSVLKDVSGFGNDAYKNADSVVEFDYFNDNIRGLKYADDNKLNKRLGYTSPKNFYPNFNTTICYWTKFTITSEKAIVIFRTSNNGSYLNGTNKNVYGYIQTNDGNVGNWTGRLTENKWYFIAFTFEQSGSNIVAKSYVNGNLYNTNTRASTISVTETQLDLINYNNNASIFSICDYRVYATALSAQDIKNLYNSPIAVSKQHQTMAFELKENQLYPSKYWRTPTYAEMNYILNTRTNAANLRTLGRVEISSGTYRNGLFLLPDDFTAPSGITVTITSANYTTNSYTLAQFKQLESVGVVFLPEGGVRSGSTFNFLDGGRVFYSTGTYYYRLRVYQSQISFFAVDSFKNEGVSVRLCKQGTHFSTSAATKIDFAPANLQYHCTQHVWRFAEHSYDIIGSANANISDSYNGWIDLFGYGTSGVNYSPTLHTTNNADYASGDIANTDNDWGVNEIQSYNYNVKNFALNKNGIVQHNELMENNSDVNGCYNDKIITNKIIEN